MSPATKKNDPIGGNWIYENANGMSSAYRSLRVNTSHDHMAYNESPDPPVTPTFPTTASYFDSYADHFGIRPHIRGSAPVSSTPHGGRDLAAGPGTGQTSRFDASWWPTGSTSRRPPGTQE